MCSPASNRPATFLGNYLGAITRFVALQDDYPCIYCVVDIHAITVWQNPIELRNATREVAAAFIASGIDPKAQIIFNQSQFRAHSELAWLFNFVARTGWLNRMTQFKEKAGKDKENASVGLFAYPTLMAADILAYRATHVPVGDDQKQHLELTRDIAAKFNNDFAERIRELGFGDGFFPLIKPLISGPAPRVMSLRDGSRKMSKSDPSDYSRINLTNDADQIALKIRKARWDEFEDHFWTWNVPPAHMKGDREFVVPVSLQARNIIVAQKEANPEAEFVFPSPRNGSKMISKNTIAKILNKFQPDATVHGMRGTFRDWCDEFTDNVLREVKESVLAHANGDKVESAYLRTQYLEQRINLMQIWGLYATGVEGDYAHLANEALKLKYRLDED